MKLKLLCFLFAVLFSFSGRAQNEKYLAPNPSWVTEKVHLEPENLELSKSNGGEYPLLYDRQVNLDKKEYFFHWTTILKNSESVSLYNTLEFSFDPAYQKLEIHFINVIRNGEVINKIDAEEFKIITKEENADRKLYNNSKTLISHLKDIRQGDVLDYAFTKKGQNPAYEDHQFCSQPFQFYYDLEVFHFSVISSSEKLNFKLLKGAKEPLVTNSAGQKKYSWFLKNLKANYSDENAPTWYSTEANVCFSDLDKWEDVAQLSQPFYELSPSELVFFKKVAQEISSTDDRLEMISDLIHFVQDDIRYLGFEDGLNAFVPHRPKQVYQQRFGDCKDKSLLLIALLKSMGVEASPVLVNTYLKNELESQLASPFNFNHCVSAVEVSGKTYFIDPTISKQGGDLFNTYFPDYGKVLHIENQQLESIPENQSGTVEIEEYLKPYENNTEASFYSVKTTFRGFQADNMRSFFATNPLDYISKEYMKFYSNMYPYIRQNGELKYDDDRVGNEFVTFEKYWIDSIWEKDEEYKGKKLVYVAPLMMQNYFSHQSATKRTSDYAISFPCDISYKMTILTPYLMTIEDDTKKIENKEYSYQSSVVYNEKEREIYLEDTYKTFKDHIKAKDFPRFKSDHAKMYEDSSFGIYFENEEKGEKTFVFRSIFDFLILLFIIIVAAVGLIALNEKRKERKKKRSYKPKSGNHS